MIEGVLTSFSNHTKEVRDHNTPNWAQITRADSSIFGGTLYGVGQGNYTVVEEMIYGISSSGAVVVTKVARDLEEPIRLHDTHKRLNRNLGIKALRDELSGKVLEQGAS